MQKNNGPSEHIIPLSTSIPEVLIDKSVLDVDCEEKSFVQKELDKSALNPELIDWLQYNGLEIKLAEMFYCDIGSKVPDHFDDVEPIGCCKIIWTYGSENVPITFYKVDDQAEKIYKNNSIGGYYLTCDEEDYSFAESVIVKNPSLIRVDKLHGVENNTYSPWCAVTLVLRKIDGDSHRASWKELVEVLPIEADNG